MITPSYTITHFRGYDDDGVEGSATVKGAIDADWSQAVDEKFRARLVAAETNGGTGNNVQFQWQYNKGGAGWNNITTISSVVRATTSTYVTGLADTTQQVGTGTFITDNDGFTQSGTAGGTADYLGNDETETEAVLIIQSADVVDEDTIELRCLIAGSAPSGTPVLPTITVIEGLGVSLDKTLDALTLSGSGTVDLDGDVDATLGALTLNADGSVDIDAQVSLTLGELTLSSDTTVSANGWSADDATFTADFTYNTADGFEGEAPEVWTADAAHFTVDDATYHKADGWHDDDSYGGTYAVVDVTLGALTLSSAGSVDVDGTVDAALDDISLSSAGSVDIDGDVSVTLGDLALSSEGSVDGLDMGWTADSTHFTVDDDAYHTADGWHDDSPVEPPVEPEETGRGSWLIRPGEMERYRHRWLEQEDELILRVISEFLDKAA